MPTAVNHRAGRARRAAAWPARVARRFYALWALAAVTYCFGDIVTTFALLGRPGVYEANPLMWGVVTQAGPAGLAAVKFGVVVLGVLLSVWAARTDGRLGLYGPPVVLGLLGTALTVHNVLVALA
ncbi:MAG: DUF5658 family protein [Halobacteriaceae archaeon]